MSFNGNEGEPISLKLGGEMTARYRDSHVGERKGHFFGKNILNQILNQTGCMGIRMYYALDNEGEKQLVIVGTDANENDMLELVADVSSPCPPCGGGNPLNS